MTLLEMLVVIAVLGVLAVLAFPISQTVRSAANQTGCLNHLRNWGIANSRYATENNFLLPPAQMPLDRQNPQSRLVGWDERLAPYIPFNYQFLMKTDLEARRKSILVCPAEKEVVTLGDYTYAQNIDLNHRLQGDKALVSLTSLNNASQYVVMSDSYRSLTLSTATADRLKTSIRPERKRHGGHPNFLYADGHVAPFTHELVGYNEVTTANRDFYNNLWFARGLPPYLR